MHIQHSTFPSIVRARAAVVAILALLAPLTALALDIPPAPTQWVTDKAGILNASQADTLNRKLSDFEQSSGAQFLIYIFPSLGGEALEDFTIRCATKWKVGQKKYDNGLILFVFVQEKKLRIEVGYGLEGTITDAFSSRVIRDYIAPHFQQGDWYGGLDAAADAIIAKIRGGEAPVPPLQPRSAPQSSGTGNVAGSIIPFIILIVFVLFILPMFTRRRGGGCSGCFWPMLFMGGGRGTTFGGGGFGGGGFGGGGGFSG
ncbi:MAG TPA: TPM domain-containing protein, partial [Thermoanaerobaculia bacterium]